MTRTRQDRPSPPLFSPSRRPATLLDLPFIFELMLDGAVHGAFSDQYVRRNGAPHLMGMLLKGLLGQGLPFRSGRRRYRWELLCDPQGQPVGFFKTASLSGVVVLELLSIAHAHRDQGLGSALVARLVEDLPAETRLLVHCTKYARAMQRVLKKQQFKRNTRFTVHHLEEYCMQAPGAADAPGAQPGAPALAVGGAG